MTWAVNGALFALGALCAVVCLVATWVLLSAIWGGWKYDRERGRQREKSKAAWEKWHRDRAGQP